MSKILFVANVGKEHILKFHIPTIRAFKEHGWTVDVACSGEEDIPYCDHHFRTSWKRSPFTFKTFTGIRELTRIIDNGHYDIVYCHTPVGGLCARLAARNARRCGTKVIYCAHGLHFYKGAPLINWLLFYPIEKWLTRYTDVFFTINREDYERVCNRFNKKNTRTVVLTDGVGCNFDRLDVDNKEAVRQEYRRSLNLDDTTTVLLYVAELIPNKNQRMLVDAAKILRKTHNCHLLLVGPEHDGGALKRYIDDSGMGDCVSLLGWQSNIGEWMAASDIYVASSLREGFAINLVEAMYCGLPVVASRNRGHISTVVDGENGFIVDQNDSAAMADRLKQLLSDKDLFDQFSHIDVSRYDCDRIAQDLYTRITES